MNSLLKKSKAGSTCLFVLSVAAVGVFVYLPAVHNSFISDDFTMIPFVRALEAHPGAILEIPSEIFRAVSYLWFWMCLKTFGPVPEFFYWMGIGLHVLVSLLVGRLIFVLSRSPGAAWAGALYFTAYERHQEAVMWISAVNDTLVTMFVLIFLLLWSHSLSHGEHSWTRRIAMAVLCVALLSKEPSVMAVPLAILLMVLRKQPWRDVIRRSVPLLVIVTAYGALWLAEANGNFFVTQGYYALSLHFFPVYARSVLRILSAALLFVIPLAIVAYRASGLREARRAFHSPAALFAAGIIVLTAVPYSFLTYLDHIPSRNTYLPSVGLAILVGVLFAALYAHAGRPVPRLMCCAFLAIVVMGNATYIWIKKEPQFQARAAPTQELILALNGPGFHTISGRPIYVCGFPLHVSIGRSAVAEFTTLGFGRVAFLTDCDNPPSLPSLVWSANDGTYIRRTPSLSSDLSRSRAEK